MAHDKELRNERRPSLNALDAGTLESAGHGRTRVGGRERARGGHAEQIGRGVMMGVRGVALRRKGFCVERVTVSEFTT
jgi:hypothetical protein